MINTKSHQFIITGFYCLVLRNLAAELELLVEPAIFPELEHAHFLKLAPALGLILEGVIHQGEVLQVEMTVKTALQLFFLVQDFLLLHFALSLQLSDFSPQLRFFPS